ncbi:MDR family oxidoreductase [Pseudohalioglobus lutimaris]|uniref:Alcohol dehydrogenase n=1 Tax=Pseudohalioglobus lutimaris TaxID=1737061 RepID=A0A2N5X5E9_9GAMM|nr:MDR family oxidoreductase [Pseudohalioglobus lutimaris]PLW69709.1 alcohol dehydrogenase [Pseudohalioglobus lutimaris]
MFNALLIYKSEEQQSVAISSQEQQALPEGDVLVRVDYSTINYKDALAITGAAPVVRSFPMVPGIDLAGVVEESSHSRWQAGDKVVLNGWGVGEAHWGGLSQYARLKGDWLVPLPEAFDSRQAMIIGTAGYTAGLCVNALVDHGVSPEDGEILVTGASGGVGSIAIALLAAAGYQVVASTGKVAETEYLHALGASEIIDRATLSASGKPMQRERWAGVVDAVGGHTLANACAQTRYRGALAACGLAESMDFPTSVAPFILRGVTLYGIDSVMAPLAPRERAWARLARDLKAQTLESVATDITLAQAPDVAADVLAGKIKGRLVVDVNA